MRLLLPGVVLERLLLRRCTLEDDVRGFYPKRIIPNFTGLAAFFACSYSSEDGPSTNMQFVARYRMFIVMKITSHFSMVVNTFIARGV